MYLTISDVYISDVQISDVFHLATSGLHFCLAVNLRGPLLICTC